jgi:aspartokinase/homoserine dehydrogenase 1
MKVFKFGGSSVGTPDRIKKVISIIAGSKNNDEQIAVVVSAFQKVTDQLIQMSTMASEGKTDYKTHFSKLEERHKNTVKDLIKPENLDCVLKSVEELLKDLSNVLYGIYLVKELSHKTQDYVLSFGERLSAYIISEAAKNHGVDAEYLDCRSLLKTDDSFGSARVDFSITNSNIQKYFQEHKVLQVITGYIGSTERNETTTLGRGGSDYTASIFGAALDAEEIQIWTDVDGVMTADPGKVTRAFSLESISYEEAMEMSHFGAKVIHPPTMQPALVKDIPIRIKNTFNPPFEGTLISKKGNHKAMQIKGMSSIDEIALLRISGSGMIGVAGIAKRIFGALADHRISVILITQASSEHSLCIAVPPKLAKKAKSVIEEEFKFEIREKLMNQVVIETDLSIVAVVGENMRNTPGVSGKVFQALGKNGINIIAIAQGSSELNISTVIPKAHESKALNAIHDAFFLSGYKSINLFVVGTGLIGGTLFKQIQNQLEFLAKELFVDLKIIAIANDKRMVFDTNGIPINSWGEELNSGKGEESNLEVFVSKMKSLNLTNSIFVDCTSSEEILTKYLEILESSISIVTPNKKANSSKYEFYTELKRAAQKHNVKFYYETNVGAGLPIIHTIQDLVTSGDKIFKIEGILSGTLSYLFNTYDGSVPFSKVLRDAQKKGYTEPDPRDDLNGLDVARKILILVRESGYQLELSDIDVENLTPEEARGNCSIEEFYKILEKYDDEFLERYKQAVSEDKVLRYIAHYENGKAEIKLKAVDRKHPFYSLSANDNILALQTAYYCERPMVVQRPGAGAEVTSGGVFADIIRIANYLS